MTVAALGAILEPRSTQGRSQCSIVDQLRPALRDEARECDIAGRFCSESVTRLREAGVTGATAPEHWGGGGVKSLYDLAVVMARVAEGDPSAAIGLAMHSALGWYFARDIRTAAPGTDRSLQEGWVREFASRRMIVGSAVAEPGETSWTVKTTARRRDQGWVIDGRKILVSISPAATHFYTRLRVEQPDGARQGTVMIPRSARGVEVLDNWDGHGLRGSGSGEIRFTGVELPHDAIFDRGPWGVRTTDDAGRAASTCLTVGVYYGIAEAAHSAALGVLRSESGRKRLEKSTAQRANLAEMELQLASIRGALHVALCRLDHELVDRRPGSHSEQEGGALLREVVLAGMLVERGAGEVVHRAMELVGGGMGYGRDSLLGRLARDVGAAAFMRPLAPPDAWADFLVSSIQ